MFKSIWVSIAILYTYKLPNYKWEHLEIFFSYSEAALNIMFSRHNRKKQDARGIWAWCDYDKYRRLFSTPQKRGRVENTQIF